MISIKCKNCGGEMSVDSQGLLYCEYCGTKSAFRDEELKEYRNFRYQILKYLKGVHDQKENTGQNEDRLWDSAETVTLETADHVKITIRYLYSLEDESSVMYLTRNNVLYLFRENQSEAVRKTEQALRMLSFPAADMKELNRCFPVLTGKYELSDQSTLLTYERAANVFPLAMFGSLAPEHAAWIVSRLENICCTLEYSDLCHAGISEDSVFINPFTHHAVLYGHWWSAHKKSRNILPGGHEDLLAVRRTALRILGGHRKEIPQAFEEFLSQDTAEDAYTDFEKWDKVIEEGFGGRRFVKMGI